MVSWVPELLIPCLVALAAFPQLPRRWVVALAPTTYLADLDYILPLSWAHALGMDHLHRVATHTLVWRALLLLGLWWAWRRRARGTVGFWRYATTPGWPLAILLATYYLTAHSLMDVFTGGAVLLWPLSNINVYVDLRILVNLNTGEITPQAETGTSEGPFQLDPSYEWLSNEHAAMLALVLAVLAVLGVRALLRRRGQRGADAVPATSQGGDAGDADAAAGSSTPRKRTRRKGPAQPPRGEVRAPPREGPGHGL